MEALTALWADMHRWLFEAVVAPVVYALGFTTYLEQAFDATEFFLIGVIEVALLAIVLGALERWRPADSQPDPKAIRVDIAYTLLHRLGIAPLLLFVALTPLVDGIDGWLRMQGWIPAKLEDWIPGLAASPLLSFCAYVVILDFVQYWLHRAQHRFEPWWALHSLHHSQRSMTFWTDDRNHLLDDVVVDAVLAMTALVLGAAPGQFLAFIALTRVVESLSHANVRMSYGRLGERLLVSPRFHRVHHAIGIGHEGPQRGCNFATLFPAWDHLFGTADGRAAFPQTGVADQLDGRDYGRGFLAQQGLGLRRLVEASVRTRPARRP